MATRSVFVFGLGFWQETEAGFRCKYVTRVCGESEAETRPIAPVFSELTLGTPGNANPASKNFFRNLLLKLFKQFPLFTGRGGRRFFFKKRKKQRVRRRHPRFDPTLGAGVGKTRLPSRSGATPPSLSHAHPGRQRPRSAALFRPRPFTRALFPMPPSDSRPENCL